MAAMRNGRLNISQYSVERKNYAPTSKVVPKI